ncbi:MAG: ABC transporter ATP-binding protein [Flexilinea sp.]
MSGSILEVKNINFSYGNQPVLHDISCSVPKGSFISLIGPNGSGKSTLIWILCGIMNPKNGTVSYNGENVFKMKPLIRSRKFAVIAQQEQNIFPFTCLETVMLGLHPHRSRFSSVTNKQMEKVWRAMELTGTQQFADKSIMQISGGEFQKVVIARALAQQPEILFMDEAISGLDICEKIRILKQLRNLSKETGLTIISISHDIDTVHFSDAVIALKKGQVAASGTPEDVMTESFFENVFNVKAEIIPGKGFFIHDAIQ